MNQQAFCEYVWGEAPGLFVQQHAAVQYRPESCQAVGLVRNGQMIAAVLFTDFNGVSMMVHQAIRGDITRKFLWLVSDYAFRRCGVRKLLGTVTESNEKAHRLVKHMGFKVEARVEDAAPDGAITLYSMTKDACRFLKEKYARGN